MTSTPDFKPDAIKMLAEILNETGLTELEYEFNGSRIRVVKQPAPITSMMMPSPTMAAPIQTEAAAAMAAPKEEINLANNPDAVLSPMVGTVYHSPAPNAPAFVQVGDSVSAGQVIVILEAMKVMNPVKAKKAGIVKRILVENAQPVEYDQPLFIIA